MGETQACVVHQWENILARVLLKSVMDIPMFCY